MASNDILQWINGIPPVTRFIFIPSVVIPILMRIAPSFYYLFMFNYASIKYLQLWRIVTPLFLAMPSFGYLMDLYFRYSYSTQLEITVFAGKTADYVYFIIVNVVFFNVFAVLLDWSGNQITSFWHALTISLIYLWSRYNPETIVRFLFGVQFKAVYLPLVMIGLDLLLGGSIVGSVIGLITSHIYYFLQVIYPAANNTGSLLKTPRFLFKIFPITKVARTTTGSFTVVPPKSDSSAYSSVFSGKGRRLGD